jgi:hypothetical protein
VCVRRTKQVQNTPKGYKPQKSPGASGDLVRAATCREPGKGFNKV